MILHWVVQVYNYMYIIIIRTDMQGEGLDILVKGPGRHILVTARYQTTPTHTILRGNRNRPGILVYNIYFDQNWMMTWEMCVTCSPILLDNGAPLLLTFAYDPVPWTLLRATTTTNLSGVFNWP